MVWCKVIHSCNFRCHSKSIVVSLVHLCLELTTRDLYRILAPRSIATWVVDPPLYAVVMINFKTFQETRILKLTVEEFCLEEFGDVEKE